MPQSRYWYPKRDLVSGTISIYPKHPFTIRLSSTLPKRIRNPPIDRYNKHRIPSIFYVFYDSTLHILEIHHLVLRTIGHNLH